MSFFRPILVAAALSVAALMPAQAADRGKIEAFMQVTGFDVALDSLRLSARMAPQLLGLSEENFGEDWTRLADEVFEEEGLRSDALDILEQTMSDEMLDHAADFYASDLGQRLVEIENAAHMDDSEETAREGEELAAQYLEENPERIQIFRDMSAAIGTMENSLRAITEVQVRFLMAASNAGLTERRLDEDSLRELFAGRAAESIAAMQVNSVTNASATYRDFSNEEMRQYLEALEEPLMQQVYELMNAVTFQLQADRFETLAARMVDLYPQQDI